MIPRIEVVANGELGTANGAYAASLGEILVSADYFLARHQDLALRGVEGDVAAVAGLLLEEIGHKLDVVLSEELMGIHIIAVRFYTCDRVS